MVEQRLAEVGVVIDDPGAAVAHDIGHQRADHLRVAVVTTFGDVDVAAGEFQRGVDFLQAALDVLLAVDQQRRDDLHRAADGHRDEHQHREGQVVLNHPLVPTDPLVGRGFERVVGLDAQQHRHQ